MPADGWDGPSSEARRGQAHACTHPGGRASKDEDGNKRIGEKVEMRKRKREKLAGPWALCGNWFPSPCLTFYRQTFLRYRIV
jgi:hypothetical protein